MAATSFPKSEIKILLLENIHPVAAEAFRAEGFQVETTIKRGRSERRVANFRPSAVLATLLRTGDLWL